MADVGKPSKAQVLYLEDLYVGQRFTSGSHLLDALQIGQFASEFDPQPFHLDEDAANPSPVRRLGGKRLPYRRSDDATAGARGLADRRRHRRLRRRIELA
jgi:hypothetical protein